jgi:meiotically up-regulated gene 157 (Mug157) protein
LLYKVDGFGNYFFGDDANVPSLLALPFFGYVKATDAVYKVCMRASLFFSLSSSADSLAVAVLSLLLSPPPSLLPSLQSTRKLLLSNLTNPYFYGCGTITECGNGTLGGIGSEDASGNAGLGRIWALSLMTRLLTVDGDSAEADKERVAILNTLVETSGGTGLMHESYWYADSQVYTRFWFAMANSYMGEVLMHLAETRPHLLFVGASRERPNAGTH